MNTSRGYYFAPFLGYGVNITKYIIKSMPLLQKVQILTF
jgi:hypothetical protein